MCGGGDQGKKYAPAGENLSVRSLQLFTFFRARTGGGKFTHHFRPPSLSRFEFPSTPPAAKICEWKAKSVASVAAGYLFTNYSVHGSGAFGKAEKQKDPMKRGPQLTNMWGDQLGVGRSWCFWTTQFVLRMKRKLADYFESVLFQLQSVRGKTVCGSGKIESLFRFRKPAAAFVW